MNCWFFHARELGYVLLTVFEHLFFDGTLPDTVSDVSEAFPGWILGIKNAKGDFACLLTLVALWIRLAADVEYNWVYVL